MPDLERGLYPKFIVHRTDREDGEGRRHYDCEYFVLDVNHDPHAKAAIKAYAESCRAEYPALAADLDLMLTRCRFTRDWEK
jgi:hypothetical protein